MRSSPRSRPRRAHTRERGTCGSDRRPRPRDVGIARGAEAPVQVDRMGDPDARAADDLRVAPRARARADPDRPAREARPVLRQPDAERLRELSRARAEIVRAHAPVAVRARASREAATREHLLDALEGL